MKQYQVIELASQAGFDATISMGHLQIGIEDGIDWVGCKAELLRFASLVEQATLERAHEAVAKLGHGGDFKDACLAIRNLAKESR